MGYINEVNLCTVGRIHLQVGGKCDGGGGGKLE